MKQGHSDEAGRPSPQEIISALEDPNYRGRTVKGIAQQLGYEPDSIKRVLPQSFGEVIRLSAPTKDGQTLYTTRRHYRETTPFWRRIIAALRNRAD